MIDNYVEPAMSLSDDLNQKYINRMLGNYEETRDIDVSITPVTKPRKNKP